MNGWYCYQKNGPTSYSWSAYRHAEGGDTWGKFPACKTPQPHLGRSRKWQRKWTAADVFNLGSWIPSLPWATEKWRLSELSPVHVIPLAWHYWQEPELLSLNFISVCCAWNFPSSCIKQERGWSAVIFPRSAKEEPPHYDGMRKLVASKSKRFAPQWESLGLPPQPNWSGKGRVSKTKLLPTWIWDAWKVYKRKSREQASGAQWRAINIDERKSSTHRTANLKSWASA